MKKTVMLNILMLFFLIVLTACGNSTNQEANQNAEGELTIYTTVYPLQYFAKEIGKELVTVETIYPPGTDEHTYEPTQKEMMKMADADLFVYIGFGLEGFVEKAEKALQGENVQFLAAGENIHFTESEEHGLNEHTDHHEDDASDEHDHSHNDIDPHIWIDPVYSIQLADSIKRKLIDLLPNDSDKLEANYSLLVEKLEQLDNDMNDMIHSAKRKEFIVSHAAYGYWERRYNLKQLSISGISSSSEPSQKDLERIVKTAKEHNISHIFFEQNTTSRTTEVIQNELGAKPLTLHNLSVLTDEDIKEGRDYFSIMYDNLAALEIALNE